MAPSLNKEQLDMTVQRTLELVLKNRLKPADGPLGRSDESTGGTRKIMRRASAVAGKNQAANLSLRLQSSIISDAATSKAPVGSKPGTATASRSKNVASSSNGGEPIEQYADSNQL